MKKENTVAVPENEKEIISERIIAMLRDMGYKSSYQYETWKKELTYSSIYTTLFTQFHVHTESGKLLSIRIHKDGEIIVSKMIVREEDMKNNPKVKLSLAELKDKLAK